MDKPKILVIEFEQYLRTPDYLPVGTCRGWLYESDLASSILPARARVIATPYSIEEAKGLVAQGDCAYTRPASRCSPRGREPVLM